MTSTKESMMTEEVGPPDPSAETAVTYARSGFGGGFAKGVRPAVVVVDFQRGFTDPESPTGADMAEQIEQTNRLAAAVREAGGLVAFTTIAYEADGPDVTWLRKARGMAALTAGSPWVEIDPRCDRRSEDPVIVKQHASAFFGTRLLSLLVSHRVDSLIVCGATTSGCVRATAVDSVSAGFPTFVPHECVADRARGPHDAALFDLQEKYADVESVQSLIAHVQGIAPRRSTA